VTSILVVDDDPHVRRFLRTVLAGHGHVVHEASTVAGGIAAFREHQPAIVLLDLGLPDGDGLAVLRALRPDSRVPVIVLSARGQEGDKVAALDAGADDYPHQAIRRRRAHGAHPRRATPRCAAGAAAPDARGRPDQGRPTAPRGHDGRSRRSPDADRVQDPGSSSRSNQVA
jgi:DNA-binding response OmpR family regulator